MGLLLAAALLAVPLAANAQGKGKKPPKKGAVTAPADSAPTAAPADSAPTTVDADAPPADSAAPADTGTPDAGDDKGICDVDPSQCPNVDLDAAAKKDIQAQMYAVQQIYALRARRVEFNPFWALTLNDQFVSHPGPGANLNYYITNVIAVGLTGTWYGPFNSDSSFNAETRRAARVAVPLTEYQGAGAVNFTYVPVYGKFAGFGDFIFHYDAFVTGGVGGVFNKPIAVIDPDNRTFNSKFHLAFDAGIGLRIFFNRWFAAVLEVRDYIFLDQLENTTVSATKPADKSTWYAKDDKLTNNVQAQLGLSVFLPFSWDYRLPK